MLPPENIPTLAEMGLDKKTSKLAQLGRMLKDAPKNTGVRMAGSTNGLGGTKVEPPSIIPTLAEMGLDKKTSKLAQLGRMLKDAPRNTAEHRVGGGSMSTKKVLIHDAAEMLNVGRATVARGRKGYRQTRTERARTHANIEAG